MSKAYHLTATPVLVDLGAAGKATAKASVPFFVGPVLHCADYVHKVGTGRRCAEVFRASQSIQSPGVLRVWAER